MTTTSLTALIADFVSTMNHGDEIQLADGSCEQGTGLILSYYSTGLALIDAGHVAELETTDPAVAAAAAQEWAAATGATLRA